MIQPSKGRLVGSEVLWIWNSYDSASFAGLDHILEKMNEVTVVVKQACAESFSN